MLDIEVNLTLLQTSGEASFGIPLLAAANVAETGDATAAVPYTECKTLTDVVNAGFTESSKMYDAVALMLKQDRHPNTFAVYGGSSEALLDDSDEWENENWRQLVVVDPGTSTIKDIAAKVETLTRKIFFTSMTVEGYAAMTDPVFKTAWETAIGDLKAYERTVVMFYSDEVDTPEAALVGATAAKDVGSFTYKNLILKGVPALTLSDGKIRAINGSDDKGHALTIVKKAGDIVTSEGKVTSGEYIDVIDSLDWIIYYVGYEGQKVLNASDKVPYTTPGITQLENAVVAVLKRAFDNGMIAPTEDNEEVGNYSTNFLPKSDMTDDDIKKRRYTGGNFSFELAGAIHEAEINGSITI